MKQKPRWTLEMLIAALAVLCALLTLALLVQRPAGWPALAVLVVLWGIGICVFRYQLRRWTAKWVAGGSFENSRTQYSLESLSQPAALLSGETVLWYNSRFRTALLGGEDRLAGRAQKLLPGLDTAQARTPEGQQLNLADGVWNVHSSTVPGGSESMTLLVFNEETALRRIETEYKASRPGYMVFLVDGYDDVFSDMLDSERARLLEGINRVLEDMIGRGTGFLRRVASGRYIAVVEERHLEQYAQRGYDVLDKIRALDPSVNLSISIGIGRGAKTLREAQDMAVQALDMAQGRGGDQAAEMTPDGFTFYGGVSHGVEKRSKVRSRIVADQLVRLVKEADHVVIMGHRMSDLDAIGAAEGVLRICKICDVPAVIAVRRDATLAGSLIDALCRAGQADDFIDPKGALPIISKKTLCVVVDTYQLGLVESKEILERCGKVAVIDHHRKGVGFIEHADLVCHEPYSSSASELVTELLQYVGDRDDKPSRVEAEGLLSGIMLDTRDFTLHTGVRTFEAAAALRRYGAETERVRQLFDVTMVEYKAISVGHLRRLPTARMWRPPQVGGADYHPPPAGPLSQQLFQRAVHPGHPDRNRPVPNDLNPRVEKRCWRRAKCLVIDKATLPGISTIEEVEGIQECSTPAARQLSATPTADRENLKNAAGMADKDIWSIPGGPVDAGLYFGYRLAGALQWPTGRTEGGKDAGGHRGAAECGLSGRPGEPERTGRQGGLYRPGGCLLRLPSGRAAVPQRPL